MKVVRWPLAAVLATFLFGCAGSGDRLQPPSSTSDSSDAIEHAGQMTSTPMATQATLTDPSPSATPTPSMEATSTPTPTPSAEPTPLAECDAATGVLREAEAEALTAAAAIERFLTSPLARGVAAVPEGLPEPEIDGSHVNRYQALSQTAGLTEMLLDEEGWAAVTGWQQSWAVAESFGDNPELWDIAGEAAMAVAVDAAGRLSVGKEFAAGTTGGIVLLASGVAEWRAAWLRAPAVTSPAAMWKAHADALNAASRAFTFATLGSGREGITEDQFTDPLAEALNRRLAAARELVGLNC